MFFKKNKKGIYVPNIIIPKNIELPKFDIQRFSEFPFVIDGEDAGSTPWEWDSFIDAGSTVFALDASAANHGSYGYSVTWKADGAYAYGNYAFTAVSEIYIRQYIKWSSDYEWTASGKTGDGIGVRGGSELWRVLCYGAGTVPDRWWFDGPHAGSGTSVTNFSLNAWHMIEIHIKIAASGGGWEIWIDEDQILDDMTHDTSGYNEIDNIRTPGGGSGVQVDNCTTYIDDIEAATSYIGPYQEEGLSISVFDGLSMSEVIGPSMPLGPISKYETLTVTELISLLKDILPNVYDQTTIAEIIQIIMNIKPNVFDSLTIEEWTNIIIEAFGINISENITVQESIQIFKDILISIYDELSIEEFLAIDESIRIFVYDALTLEEGSQILLPTLSVFETLSIQEQIAIIKDILVSNYDAITIQEQVSIIKDILISNYENLTVQEQISIVKDILISAHEDLTIEEYAIVSFGDLVFSIYDAIGILESVLLSIPVDISVFDALSIFESVSLSIPIEVSVSEAVSVLESTLLSIPINLSIYDALSVLESILISMPNIISVYDAIGIMEDMNIEIPISLSTIDNLTVSEYIQISTILASGLVDISFSSKKPNVSFSSKKPDVSFGSKKPKVNFS